MRSAMFHKYLCEQCLMEGAPLTHNLFLYLTHNLFLYLSPSSSSFLGRKDGLLPHSGDQIPTSDPCLVPRSHDLGHSLAPGRPTPPLSLPVSASPEAVPATRIWGWVVECGSGPGKQQEDREREAGKGRKPIRSAYWAGDRCQWLGLSSGGGAIWEVK